MLKPLERWVCDVCGGTIYTETKMGMVVWNYSETGLHNFRIIHQTRTDNVFGGCDTGDFDAWHHVAFVLGVDGLAVLLAFFTHDKVRNPSELVDLVHRLHTPHYEEARSKPDFSRAASEGWLSVAELKSIIERSP